ncbi:unnamed protein product, partial [Gulo gulo]
AGQSAYLGLVTSSTTGGRESKRVGSRGEREMVGIQEEEGSGGKRQVGGGGRHKGKWKGAQTTKPKREQRRGQTHKEWNRRRTPTHTE